MTENQKILDRLIAGETVRTIKENMQIGAEKIQKVREANPNLIPKKEGRGSYKRTGTRTNIFTNEKRIEFDKGYLKGYKYGKQEQNSINNNSLLNHEEILFLEKMKDRMLRHRSIHNKKNSDGKSEEDIFLEILNKLKNF